MKTPSDIECGSKKFERCEDEMEQTHIPVQQLKQQVIIEEAKVQSAPIKPIQQELNVEEVILLAKNKKKRIL